MGDFGGKAKLTGGEMSKEEEKGIEKSQVGGGRKDCSGSPAALSSEDLSSSTCRWEDRDQHCLEADIQDS